MGKNNKNNKDIRMKRFQFAYILRNQKIYLAIYVLKFAILITFVKHNY